MIPAAFDYQDPADERGWDDDDTRVDECVHGEHPIECSMCTSAGFHAAVSGEEEEMAEDNEKDPHINDNLKAWISRATLVELKSAKYAIERQVELRRADNERERKELEQFEKPVRKQRSDAGTTRPRKTEAA